MTGHNIIISALCSAFLFASCVTGGDEGDPGDGNRIVVGDTVPVFTVENSEGTYVQFTKSNFTGKKTLLVFFYTKCKDCNREKPKVQRVWDELEDYPGFQLITIARGEDATTGRGFWNRATMPCYGDMDKSAFLEFADHTVPRLYTINPQGIVTWIAIEHLDLSEEELVAKIKSL